MDILAHGLWTNAVFYKKYQLNKKNRYLAVLFGLLPDIISFAPSFAVLIFTGARFNFDKALYSQEWIYWWGRESYNYTHSLIIFLTVMTVLMLARKGRVHWPLWGWGLHVLLDIFSHRFFFQTPFLFPVSDFTVAGFSWGHPIFMIFNYGALAFAYIFRFLVLRKRNAKPA